MSASWTFVLADAGGNALAELSTAAGRTIAFKRNSYVEVNLTLSHEDDATALLLSALSNTGVPKLRGYRRGSNDAAGPPATLRFVGYLAGLQETSEETSLLTATFRSPFAALVGDGDRTGRFLQGQFPTIYTATDAGVIASDLVSIANLDSPTGLGTDLGLVATTKARDRTYPVGQNIGAAISDLTAVLDGFDFYESFNDTSAPQVMAGAPTITGATVVGGGSFGSAGFAAAGTWFWAILPRNPTPGVNYPGVTFPVTAGQAFTLTWTPGAGSAGYHIYRASSISALSVSPSLVAGLPPTATSYTDIGTLPLTGAASTNPAVVADADLTIVTSLGVVNPSARFEYGPATLSNVNHMDRTTTPPINCMFVTGGNGLTSTYSDATSVAKYGKWWGKADFSSIIEQATLDDKAKALVRPNPIKTVKFIPELGLANCPKPFDDWNLGDTVSLYAARSSLVDNAQVRINGFTIPIDENGNETVSVDDPTSPEEDAVMTASLIAEIVVADGGSIPG